MAYPFRHTVHHGTSIAPGRPRTGPGARADARPGARMGKGLISAPFRAAAPGPARGRHGAAEGIGAAGTGTKRGPGRPADAAGTGTKRGPGRPAGAAGSGWGARSTG